MSGATSSSAARVIVFIDAQNFYRSARRAFFPDGSHAARYGQFSPRLLGELLTERDHGRQLVQLRLYTGRPDAYLQPRTHSANVRQCQAWAADGCYVLWRPLRYPRNWPDNADGRGPQEKGIDVAMALDIVNLALRDEYDVAIVCSGDTDLIPAIEQVLDETGKTVEVAGWREGRYRQRLSIQGRNLWCHWLHREAYERVRDDRDYAALT